MLKGVVENDDKAWKEFYLYLQAIDRNRDEGGWASNPSEDDLNELHQRVMVELFQRGSVKKYQKERGTSGTISSGSSTTSAVISSP